MAMFPLEILTLIGTVIVIGVVLATLILIATARTNQRIDNHLARTDDRFDKFLITANEKFDKYLAEAASDRRALQSSMDDFRREMQRLAERQSRLEGQPAASPSPAAVTRNRERQRDPGIAAERPGDASLVASPRRRPPSWISVTRSGCAMSGRRFGAVSARISRTPARPSRPVRAPVERTNRPFLCSSPPSQSGQGLAPARAPRTVGPLPQAAQAGRASSRQGGWSIRSAPRRRDRPDTRIDRVPAANLSSPTASRHRPTSGRDRPARSSPRRTGRAAAPRIRRYRVQAASGPDSATATRPRRTVASRGLTPPAAGTLSACPLTPSTPPLPRPMTIPLAPPRHTGRNPAGARHPLRPRPAFRALPCRTPQTGIARPSLIPDSRTRIARHPRHPAEVERSRQRGGSAEGRTPARASPADRSFRASGEMGWTPPTLMLEAEGG